MSDLAIAEPHKRQVVPKRAKRDRISPRLRKAIHALIAGEAKTIRAAAAIAGLHENHLSAQLRKPGIQAFYERESRETIGRAVMRASGRLVELIDSDSHHVSLDAAKHTLGIAGIKPADEAKIVNNINVLAGYMVDLSPEPMPVVIDAVADTQSTDPVYPDDDANER